MEASGEQEVERILGLLEKEPLDTRVVVAGFCHNSTGMPRSSNPYVGDEKLEAAWYMGWDRYEKERQEGRRPSRIRLT